MSCELLLHVYPKISEVEELRSTYITNIVFNSFLSHTAIMLNHDCNNPRYEKSVVITKDFEDTAPESSCFWCWCWFIESAVLHLTSGKMVTTKQPRL